MSEPEASVRIHIEYDERGRNGKGAVLIKFMGVELGVSLEDAETIGELLIACVRIIETKRRKTQ